MSTKPEKPSQKPLNAYAKFSSLGIQMALIIGAGCYGGHKLDLHFQNKKPVFTIILSKLFLPIQFINEHNESVAE